MNINSFRGLVIVFLWLVAACGPSGPTAPTATSQPPPSSAPQPPVATQPPAAVLPPLSGPSRTFVFDRALSFAVRDYTKTSRFVLYDNGAFELQYPSLGPGGYRGGYAEANGTVTFEWEGSSTAGPWSATGTLIGESLTVKYNLIMQMTDFEDAEYVRSR
jgi:hypothetical protein